MNQFKIRGIDYTDERPTDYLMHTGPGKPGRAKGSKNGQIDPRAVAMKYYDVVGKKAVGEPARPGTTNTRSTTLKTIGAPNTTRTNATQQVRSSNTRTVTGMTRQRTGNVPTVTTAQRASVSNLGRTASTTSTPVSKVEKGKQALASLNGGNYVTQPTQPKPATVMQGTNGDWKNQTTKRSETTPANAQQTAPTRNRDMSTKELRDLDPVGDWPWSNRRVNAAGGLKAREGRQIVYDNPTLSDDYKKQVAKKYGDSDGKSYPKYLENNTAQPAANTQQNKPDVVLEGTNGEWRNQGKDAVTNQSAGGQADRVPVRSDASDMVQRAMNSAAQQAQAKDEITNQSAGLAADRIPVRSDAADMVQRSLNSAQQAPAKNADTQKAAETPEQKSFWDNVGGWFSQAGKDIGDTVSGAWNTTSKAVSDAANWVGNRMGPVGDWAQTAYNDVSAWVGDRGKDLDAWWNGRDVEVNDNGRWRQGHQTGVGEQIGSAANAVGQWIGNAAGDVGRTVSDAANGVGRAVGDWWNGRDVEVNDNGRWRQGHESGMRENLGNAANAAGQWIGDRAQDVSNFVTGVQPGTPQGTPYWDAATGQYVDPSMPSLAERIGTAADNTRQAIGNWWNGTDQTPGVREGLMNGANAAGQWIGNTANNVGQAVGNAWNGAVQGVSDFARNAGNTIATAGANRQAAAAGVAPSEIEQANQLLSNGTYTPETYNNYVNGLANIQNVERASAQTGWDGVPADVRALNERENWLDNNIVAPVANAANGAGDFVRNTANNVGQAVGNAANAAGQWIGNTANNVGQAVGNAANGVRNWAGETAQNVRDTADVAGLAGRAIAAGVPMDLVGRWTQNYNNGQITPSEFEDLLDRWTSNNR